VEEPISSALNGDFLTETINRAVDAGIPVVTWDSDAPNSKRLAVYGVGDVESGRILGEQAITLLNGKGKVAMITGVGAAGAPCHEGFARRSMDDPHVGLTTFRPGGCTNVQKRDSVQGDALAVGPNERIRNIAQPIRRSPPLSFRIPFQVMIPAAHADRARKIVEPV
jgi:hypothetical protein